MKNLQFGISEEDLTFMHFFDLREIQKEEPDENDIRRFDTEFIFCLDTDEDDYIDGLHSGAPIFSGCL